MNRPKRSQRPTRLHLESPEQLGHREWVNRIFGPSGEVIDLQLANVRKLSNTSAAGLVGVALESMVDALIAADAAAGSLQPEGTIVDSSRLEALRGQQEQISPAGLAVNSARKDAAA